MRDDHEDTARGAVGHRLGEALDTLSLEDLAARIALLRAEIARIEAAREAKAAARERAGSIFKL